ncbi:MAG TPA: hypothetical protein ENK53_00050, partial [Thiotrichales bacterium]|nr:hypothetical protein [Thiotrichales bacterium]
MTGGVMSHGLRVVALGFVAFASSLFAVGAQAIVGALSGQYQTTHAGSAAYVIPIDLPPGIGVKPSLSLVYDSNAGEGIAGLGWRLEGGGAITRCPATRHQDGFFDPVDFDDNDRFCLDGQRLVAVKGVYGQDGTEYRTEIDTYARIISHGDSYDSGGQRTGPEYFEVRLKSGEIKVFGQDPRSRVRIGNGSVLTWNLSQVRDRFDNRILYDYYNSALDDPGKGWVEVYLRGIEYSATKKEAPLVHVALKHV